MKKLIIYAIIFLVWLIVCHILYVFNLIDWIGIILSFIFAIPPALVDIISSKVHVRRQQQLEHIANLQKFLKQIDDMSVENYRVNEVRRKAGFVKNMGLIDITTEVHTVFQDPTSQACCKKSLNTVFGKKKSSDLYSKMENDRQAFKKVLDQKILQLNPTQNECDFYKLILSNDLKQQLFIKQHKELKEII